MDEQTRSLFAYCSLSHPLVLDLTSQDRRVLLISFFPDPSFTPSNTACLTLPSYPVVSDATYPRIRSYPLQLWKVMRTSGYQKHRQFAGAFSTRLYAAILVLYVLRCRVTHALYCSALCCDKLCSTVLQSPVPNMPYYVQYTMMCIFLWNLGSKVFTIWSFSVFSFVRPVSHRICTDRWLSEKCPRQLRLLIKKTFLHDRKTDCALFNLFNFLFARIMQFGAPFQVERNKTRHS